MAALGVSGNCREVLYAKRRRALGSRKEASADPVPSAPHHLADRSQFFDVEPYARKASIPKKLSHVAALVLALVSDVASIVERLAKLIPR
jgi:hypothetical protein